MIRHFLAFEKSFLMRHRARRVYEIDQEISALYDQIRELKSKIGRRYRTRDALTYPLRYRMPFDEKGLCEIGGFLLQVKFDEKPRRARVIKSADGSVRILHRGHTTRITVKRKKAAA